MELTQRRYRSSMVHCDLTGLSVEFDTRGLAQVGPERGGGSRVRCQATTALPLILSNDAGCNEASFVNLLTLLTYTGEPSDRFEGFLFRTEFRCGRLPLRLAACEVLTSPPRIARVRSING
eukprot:171562-Prorocentrum_minimum.AAC.1